jgi:hypothetical protein
MWTSSTFYSVLPLVVNITIQETWYDYIFIYGFWGFPLILILSMNFAIFLTAVSLSTNSCGQNQSNASLRWGVTVTIVSVILTISFLPNIIWWQMELLELEMISSQSLKMSLSMVTHTIQVFNSCSNPIIYVIRTKTFRKVLVNNFKWITNRSWKTDAVDAVSNRVNVFYVK